MENFYNFYGSYAKNDCGYGKIVTFEDKDQLYNYHMLNFQNKLRSMFKFDGLPNEIPNRSLELQIQRGYSVIYKHNDKLYQSYGGLGGKPDFNYLPTVATIANPALRFSGKFKIYWGYEWETEEIQNLEYCVVVPNDSLFVGIIPTNSYYASQMVENDLTMNCNLINFRLMNLLIAGDDNELKSLNKVIDNLKKGKISCAVDDDWLFDSIKSLPFSNTQGNNIVQLLEQRQYIKGSWWNEWGVQSNYNMKRETITSSENILNVDSLLAKSDDMLECRQLACERVNKIFNTNWSVDFSSAWAKIRREIKAKEDIMLNEANMNKQVQKSELEPKEDDNDDKGGKE